jgi:hypothetical protein
MTTISNNRKETLIYKAAQIIGRQGNRISNEQKQP